MSSPSWRSAMRVEARHGVKLLDAESLHRGPAVAAHDGRRMEPGNAVDQVGAQQRGGELPAAFDQHRVSPAWPSAAAPPPDRPRRRRRRPRSAWRRGRRRRAGARGSVPSRIRIQVGVSAAVATRRAVSGVRRWLSAMTRTSGLGRKPGMRQVRSGSSATTVPTPTITASCRPRRAWPRRRAGR